MTQRNRSARRRAGKRRSQKPHPESSAAAEAERSRDNDEKYLAQLARRIVASVGMSPPELKAKLVYPRLKVVAGRQARINLDVRRTGDEAAAIVFGPGLLPFLRQYSRVAVVCVLSSGGSGQRRSGQQRAAYAAMASALDWACSPAAAPVLVPFGITKQQMRQAETLLDCCVRFALCHEMAHVVMGHLDTTATTQIDEISLDDVKELHEREYRADQLGLKLYLSSLVATPRPAYSLAGVVCFFEAMSLLSWILMLTADPDLPHPVRRPAKRNIGTHPPYLAREFRLTGDATGIHGDLAVAEMTRIHEDLGELNMQFGDVIERHQGEVIAEVCQIVDREVQANLGGSGSDQKAVIAPDIADHMNRLTERSPTGVLRALRRSRYLSAPGPSGPLEAEIRRAVVASIVQALPKEFQRWLTDQETATGSAAHHVRELLPRQGRRGAGWGWRADAGELRRKLLSATGSPRSTRAPTRSSAW